MGELRHNGEEAKGVWFKVKGSKIGRGGKFGFDNKYTAYELGYDEVAKRTGRKTRYQGTAILMVAAVTAEAVETTAVRRSVSTILRSAARAIIWIWC